ncbi:hypothetical protein TNCV_1932091 [Trichonephila clavipes]|nr:hypothetical protein TNCV_1932091 [Trichonephila clavipes]
MESRQQWRKVHPSPQPHNTGPCLNCGVGDRWCRHPSCRIQSVSGSGNSPSFSSERTPCKEAMHVKSVESSNVLPLMWYGS